MLAFNEILTMETITKLINLTRLTTKKKKKINYYYQELNKQDKIDQCLENTIIFECLKNTIYKN